VLGANLDPSLPVDRHIFAKRIRVWLNADGFISALDFRQVIAFRPGPPAVWQFVANAGDGRTVEIEMSADMIEGRNTTVFAFSRPSASDASGKQLPADADVRLTVRVDIEDRNFHSETKRNGGADYHFSTNCHSLPTEPGPASGSQEFRGFAFTPAPDRHLRVVSDQGRFHWQPEWSENIPHPVEQSRGQVGSGDAFSPGWFDLPLSKGSTVFLTVDAEDKEPSQSASDQLRAESLDFENQLLKSSQSFVVRRGAGKTVVAGYPWFLDWGRDTFICARGLLACGMVEEVTQILVTFAKFQKNGTLPNTIFGEDASNRDTSDAPLWFGVVCEELAAVVGASFYQMRVGNAEITIADTLLDIARNYRQGTPNGIRMDPASGLIWSPSHFTWMDTNFPACTPREGYPIEIQALWVRFLWQVERIAPKNGWGELANQALASIEKLFWLPERGYYGDCLAATARQPAESAKQDDALRSNYLFLISLGLVQGERAWRSIRAATRYLVIPGALRSLAPLPVSLPLPIYDGAGRLLNDPANPYWGRYEGDEDTRRKPAYHNGTAWTWTFPTFCEALAVAYDFSPEAVAAARAYVGSMDRLLIEGCLGHLPEILDGDAPHFQRGCDAQAWGATEALRVWRRLKGK
jgi:predicted glycogen debranching enzyme